MGLKITGLNELRERLERLRPEEVMAKALAEQAQRMAARVREGLSQPPGASGHDEPWLQSGALRDSVGAQADGLRATVGSSDPAAVPQELGTVHMPPRPFLAPAAAEMGEEVARAVGAAVAAALRGDIPDGNGTDADLSGRGLGGNDPPNRSAAGTGISGTSNGGFTHISTKADDKDDPLRELRKDLGEETPEEEEEEIEHGRFNPLHVPGIPPGGGALLFGPGRPDAGSSPPAPRTASPQPPPPAQPASPAPTTSAAPTSSTPAVRLPSPPPPAPPPTPDELTRALPGHGNDRHGTHTTTAQQTTRVQTGRTPDGKIAPTATATRFDSPEAQLDAVKRAQARTAARDAGGLLPHTVTVAPNGAVRLPRDQSVVTGYPGGYGSGVQLQKPAVPGRPVVPTGQLPNALVILEWDPRTGQWRPVTQYPTNKPVTP